MSAPTIAEILNLAAAADTASGALHNIGALTDPDEARDAFARSHRAFTHSRCELRRQRPESAANAMRKMLANLDTLTDLAVRSGRRAPAVETCRRVIEPLRDALGRLPP